MDFGKLEFDPTVKGRILDKYPILRTIFGDLPEEEIRFCIMMYDQSSPLINRYKSINDRKEAAASLSKVTDTDKVFTFIEKEEVDEESENYDEVDENGDKWNVSPYHDLLTGLNNWFKHKNSRLWAMICTNEQAFYEYQRRVMSEVRDNKDKAAIEAVRVKRELLTAMEDIDARLSGYYGKLTGDDSLLEEGLTKRRTTAESVAVR